MSTPPDETAAVLPSPTPGARGGAWARLRQYTRYHGLWTPGVRLLRNLDLARKTAVIGLFMALPCGVLVSEAVATRLQALEDARTDIASLSAFAAVAEIERLLVAGDAAGAAPARLQALSTQDGSTPTQQRATALLVQRHADWTRARQAPDTEVGRLQRDSSLRELLASVSTVAAIVAPPLASGARQDDAERTLRAAATRELFQLLAVVATSDRSLQGVVIGGEDNGTALRAAADDLAVARLRLDEIRPHVDHAVALGLLAAADDGVDRTRALREYIETAAPVARAGQVPSSDASARLKSLATAALADGSALQAQALARLHDRLAAHAAAQRQKIEQEAALLSLCVLMCVYLLVAAYKVLRGGLATLCRHLDHLGDGNLSLQPKGLGRDEIGQALGSLGESVRHMATLFAAVNQGVSAVSHASREVAVGNAGLSGRTGSIRRDIGHVASRAQSSAQAMDACGDQVEQAAVLVQAMRADAARSRKAMGGLRERMRALQGKSQEITKIIGLMESAAYQTKLLSLNASVEASRAGAAGKGFAVVAQEVRELAQRSQESAQRIHHIISDSIEEIGEGNLMTDRASEAVRLTDEKIESVNRIMAEIVNLTRTGLTESHEVLGIARQVEESAGGNARIVDQLADASVALRTQGDNLRRSVHHFVFE